MVVGVGVLQCMGYNIVGMCCCERYGFQAVYSWIEGINQSIWNRVSFFTKRTIWLKILSINLDLVKETRNWHFKI